MHTNHKALTYIYTQSHLNSRQARWWEHLAKLDLHIVYKPRVANVSAHELSCFG